MTDRALTNDQVIDLLFPTADDFQRIALNACLDDARAIPWPPQTPEDEEKLMRLGALAFEVAE